MAFGTVIRLTNPANSLIRGLSWDGLVIWTCATSGIGWLGTHEPRTGALIHDLPTMINGRGISFNGRDLTYADISLNVLRIVPPVDEVVTHDVPEPDTQVNGLNWNGQCYWAACTGDNTYKLVDPRSGAIIRSYAWPGSSIGGICFNGHLLYVTDLGNHTINALRPGGPILQSVTAPSQQPWGVTWDGRALWVLCAMSGFLYQIMVN